MAKTKISEYSATANSNTDVASINIDEGCAPSGINNAIRAVMGHLKDFQQGTNGDPFNGPVNGTLGATTPSTASVTTLTTSSTVTHNGGTANGVAYLNGSKVLTTGSALVFDGTNLGLGVTPASHNSGVKALQIKNSSLISFGTDWNLMANSYYGSSGWTYTSSAAASGYQTASGAHYWQTAASGTAGNAITFTQAMTLDASGNLLVGATSADARVFAYSSSGTSLKAQNPSNVAQLLIGYNNTSYNYMDADNNIFRSGSGTERARIDSSGNLLLSTTSQFGSGKFSVSYLGASQQGINIRDGSNQSGSAYMVFGSASGTTQGTITNNSGTGVSYNTSSDYRLKDNQQPLTNSGAFIDALQPKTWYWKIDGSKGVGFIAHEAQAVSPSSVTGKKDAIDENGKPIMQAMEYGSAEFIANIIAELQSLRARVAILEAK